MVVDEQFEEVELTDETMQQIKQAVAGAIGFVEDRDKIHISKASFLPKRVSAETENDMKKTVLLPKDTFSEKFKKRISRLWPIFIISCLISTSVIVVFTSFKVYS